MRRTGASAECGSITGSRPLYDRREWGVSHEQDVDMAARQGITEKGLDKPSHLAKVRVAGSNPAVHSRVVPRVIFVLDVRTRGGVSERRRSCNEPELFATPNRKRKAGRPSALGRPRPVIWTEQLRDDADELIDAFGDILDGVDGDEGESNRIMDVVARAGGARRVSQHPPSREHPPTAIRT